jgi:hypothetical protein
MGKFLFYDSSRHYMFMLDACVQFEVPNLVTLHAAADPIQKEKSPKSMCSSTELQRLLSDRLPKDERLRNFRELYPRHPVVMSEYFRSVFCPLV